jgi:hypothetical protein
VRDDWRARAGARSTRGLPCSCWGTDPADVTRARLVASRFARCFVGPHDEIPLLWMATCETSIFNASRRRRKGRKALSEPWRAMHGGIFQKGLELKDDSLSGSLLLLKCVCVCVCVCAYRLLCAQANVIKTHGSLTRAAAVKSFPQEQRFINHLVMDFSFTRSPLA